MGASTTLGPGVPAHIRVGRCGPAAPYLQHRCRCVLPSLQCGSAPGRGRQGSACGAGAGPARLRALLALAGRLPRAGLLRAAPARPCRAPSQPGQGRRGPVHPLSLCREEGPALQPAGHPSPRRCARLGTAQHCLQRHKQSPGAGNRGAFIRGGAERDKHSKVFWYFPIPGC